MINNIPSRWILLAVLGSAGLALGCQVARGAEPASLQGVVELEETPIGFELGGRLTQLLVKEGDVVEAGAVLARIDDTLEQSSRAARESEAQVARQQASAVKAGARGEEVRSLASRVAAARATEELLQKQATRERTLLEKGVIAAAAVDDIEGQLARATAEREALEHSLKLLRQGARQEDVSVAEARAQAALAVLELNDARLVRHELKSPIRGTILDVNFEPGEVVGAGSPVFTLADTHQPYVDVFVPQAEISRVKVGQGARIKVDALSVELPGKVEHIARRTEFTPRYLFSERERSTLVVRVRVRIEDPKEQMRAGVPAFVRLSGGQ
ncbi:MAG TPA: HlyD family efflux transporter periplasmic adaptor subunit [Polyangiaceae bacterium]|nr:HlyD family efflux transporter periplasmic adaptor subunit [Polyangiaceae bacterium]